MTDTEVCQLYINGMSTWKVAGLCGKSKGTVVAILRRHQVPLRRAGRPERLWLGPALDLIRNAGLTPKEAAERLGVKLPTLHSALSDCGEKAAPRKIAITERYYGLLYVVGCRSGNRQSYYKCLCECGKIKWIRKDSITSGRTQSCGCLLLQSVTTHGKSGHRSDTGYSAWSGMKERCYNPKTKAYPRYGGRGITVCGRWCDSFENFITDMGPRPSRQHSIERIDNNGNYCPENCRWATSVDQANNRRSNVCVTAFGATKTAAEWSRASGLNHGTILTRLGRGIDAESAVSLPPHKGKALTQRFFNEGSVQERPG